MPNEWQNAANGWNWPKIRSAYLSGQWPNFEIAAKEVGIRPGYLRQRAALEDWNSQRTALEHKAEEQAITRIRAKLAREFEKRLSGMLDTADLLRFKAVETLGDKNVKLTGAEAIKAATSATDIEREIFLRRGRPIGDHEDGDGPVLPAPNTPAGLLQAPATLSELTDEHLIRIIDAKPTPRPAPEPRKAARAAKPLGRELEAPKDGDHAPGGGKRSPAPKGRKG